MELEDRRVLLRLKRRAEEPEEVGKQIAGELREVFRRSQAPAKAEQQERARIREMHLQIRVALVKAVDGYNDHVPRESQLAVLDRGDRLLFSAGGRFTLTLRYGVDRVMIESNGVEAHGVGPMMVTVWRKSGRRESGLSFRAVPDSPVFPWEILDEKQFVYCVLRMACDQRFGGRADC
jgi:hypothetical protein